LTAGHVQRKPLASPAQDNGDGQQHEPDPGEAGADASVDLDVTRPVGELVPADIKDPLMAETRSSPRIQRVLQDIEDNGGADFEIKWSARGGYHSNGKIYIDRRETMADWISTMMHELNHLSDQRQGLNPVAADTASREDFVATKMFNEIRSHAVSYVGLLEREAGNPATAAAAPAGFDEFKAYLRADEATNGICYDSATIQAMAEAWVEKKYKTEWTTSNTGENYYDYWGAAWDDAHPAAPAAP